MRLDNISYQDGKAEIIKVTLSKRNLQTLLEKLEWNSQKTISIQTPENIILVVSSEEDEIHYKDRSPGKMINKDGAIY